jgi:hypothetical protein
MAIIVIPVLNAYYAQCLDLSIAQQIVCVCNVRRLANPQQVIDVIKYEPTHKQPENKPLFLSILNVIKLHMERYLRGEGHPRNCSEIVSSLDPSVVAQLEQLDPSILRAALFLQQSTDYESIPLEEDFHINVSAMHLRKHICSLTVPLDSCYR